MEISKEQQIIKLIFKDFLTDYNSRNISKIIKMSHAGAFKILKKLEKQDIVKSKRIGNTLIYSLNTKNPITNKKIEITLISEAQNYKKWTEEFKELKNKVKFTILFGSIIKNEKSAKDIDLLIVADKFKNIKQILEKRNKFLNKKIHPLFQTIKDFKYDLKNNNKTIINIIKTGIVLFGQEELRKNLQNDIQQS